MHVHAFLRTMILTILPLCPIISTFSITLLGASLQAKGINMWSAPYNPVYTKTVKYNSKIT